MQLHLLSVARDSCGGFTRLPGPLHPLLVRLADGREATTTPRLDTTAARHVAALVTGQLLPLSAADSSQVRRLETPLPVEVTVGTGRHGAFDSSGRGGD